jgi:multicomponent Na+:H+ antiporter subunit A
VLAVVSTLAALSMAGVPPLLGFISKEAAYEAFLHGGPTDLLVLAGLFVGSVLTAAYSARFVWGAFASKPGCAVTEPHTPPVGFLAPVVVLGVSGLVLGLLPSLADPLVQAYADSYPLEEGAKEQHLALWHGLTPALGLSALTLLAGAALFVYREPVRRLQRRLSPALSAVDADRSYDATLIGVDRVALRSTSLMQTGSLPVYLGMVLLTVVLVPGTAFLAGTRVSGDLQAYDRPLQAVVGLVIAVAAVAAARRTGGSPRCCTWARSATAPPCCSCCTADRTCADAVPRRDAALVIFMFVLRRLPSTFSSRPLRRSQAVRMAVALAVGSFVTVAVLVSSQARTAPPVSQAFLDRSLEEGGGSNVVNVVLVDFRGLDTLGEITVLAVAAMGIASLVLAASRSAVGTRSGRAVRRRARPAGGGPAGRRHAGGPVTRADAPTGPPVEASRSVVLETAVRLVFHTVLVFSVYLLFAGHNQPGGGFVGGLVAGAAFVLRYISGGRAALKAAVPVDPRVPLGLGLVVATVTGLGALAVGGQFLESGKVELELPVLGLVKVTSALPFDTGVYLVVIGLVLGVLRTLGAEAER